MTGKTNFEMVGEFRKAMQLPIGATPAFLTSAETSYFARFILEELSEYLRAVEEGHLVDAADALVDLVYVAMGCAHAMGMPFDKLFDIVHQSNMRKEPANAYIRSVRGSQYDVVKPIGWVGPECEMQLLISEMQYRGVNDIK
jgi:predicted HAD superfamily Cof-like phosphohydrolase